MGRGGRGKRKTGAGRGNLLAKNLSSYFGKKEKEGTIKGGGERERGERKKATITTYRYITKGGETTTNGEDFNLLYISSSLVEEGN